MNVSGNQRAPKPAVLFNTPRPLDKVIWPTLAGPLQKGRWRRSAYAGILERKIFSGRTHPAGQSCESRFLVEAKQKLVDDFVEAVREVNLLQKQQAQAAMDDDQDFSRFDILLHLAHEKKDAAKYAWIVHVESHRC